MIDANRNNGTWTSHSFWFDDLCISRWMISLQKKNVFWVFWLFLIDRRNSHKRHVLIMLFIYLFSLYWNLWIIQNCIVQHHFNQQLFFNIQRALQLSSWFVAQKNKPACTLIRCIVFEKKWEKRLISEKKTRKTTRWEEKRQKGYFIA